MKRSVSVLVRVENETRDVVVTERESDYDGWFDERVDGLQKRILTESLTLRKTLNKSTTDKPLWRM